MDSECYSTQDVKLSHNLQNYVLIPAKIYCFIQDENGDMFIIIHSCLQDNRKISVLTYRWELESTHIKK